jgi:hypothetical protein
MAHRGKSGNRKHNRNRKKCARYKDTNRREKNKARRRAKREARYAKKKEKKSRDLGQRALREYEHVPGSDDPG